MSGTGAIELGRRDGPFWSVMIPCWNPDPLFLAETLRSVLACGIGPDDMQVALVDDASAGFDGGRFLRQEGFERVEFHRDDSHRGIAGNWNRCLALARGQWVHILHQDDRVRPGFYQAMARGIAGAPGIGAAFCQHVFIDAGGEVVRQGHMPAREPGILRDWLQHVFVNLAIQCAAIVLSRDAVQRLGGFDNSLRYALDWDMWQRLALAYAIWYEPAPLAEQRLHPRSQSSAILVSGVKWREIAILLARMGRRLDPLDAGAAMPWTRQACLRMARAQIRGAIAVGQWRAALFELLGCLRIVRPSDFLAVASGRYPNELVASHPPIPALAEGPAADSARLPRQILFIGGTSEPGGIHIHTVDVARALAGSGARVKILNTSTDFFSQLLRDSAITVRTASPPEQRSRLACFGGWMRLLAPYRGWDLVVCRGSAGETPPIALLAMRLRARRIFTIEHRPALAGPASGFLRRLNRRLAGFLVRRAIAVSQETRSSAIEAGYLPPAKVLACLNWIEPSVFRSRPHARRGLRAHLGIGEGTIVFGFLGRLAPAKRVDLLISAFATLGRGRDIRLLLVGDGWKRKELEQQCQGLGIADRVIFAGWQADPVDSLMAMDIFVLPSLVEGFALSLLEAMAAGKVCLAHRMDSARETIIDSKSGLLCDFAVDTGLAAGLERALAMTAAERAAIGKEAAARAAARFSRHLRLPAVLRALEAPEAAGLAAEPERDRPAPRHFAFV